MRTHGRRTRKFLQIAKINRWITVFREAAPTDELSRTYRGLQ